MEINGNNARVVFKIVEVESIPCDLKGQLLAFDDKNNIISDSLKTPWRMPWIESQITMLADANPTQSTDIPLRLYNPEEPDQYVDVTIEVF